jgi:hypothetical protein
VGIIIIIVEIYASFFLKLYRSTYEARPMPMHVYPSSLSLSSVELLIAPPRFVDLPKHFHDSISPCRLCNDPRLPGRSC